MVLSPGVVERLDGLFEVHAVLDQSISKVVVVRSCVVRDDFQVQVMNDPVVH